MAGDRDSPAAEPAPHVSAEDARGGEIILRTRWRRLVFIGGLVGIVVLAIVARFSGWA